MKSCLWRSWWDCCHPFPAHCSRTAWEAGHPASSHTQIPASPWYQKEHSPRGKEMVFKLKMSQPNRAIVVDEEEGKLPTAPVDAQGLLQTQNQPHTSCLPQAPKLKLSPRHCYVPAHNNSKARSQAPQQRGFCGNCFAAC